VKSVVLTWILFTEVSEPFISRIVCDSAVQRSTAIRP
jgi:hypothetical protein